MDVLAHPVDVAAGESDGELQKLLGIQQWADGGVEPGEMTTSCSKTFYTGAWVPQYREAPPQKNPK